MEYLNDGIQPIGSVTTAEIIDDTSSFLYDCQIVRNFLDAEFRHVVRGGDDYTYLMLMGYGVPAIILCF